MPARNSTGCIRRRIEQIHLVFLPLLLLVLEMEFLETNLEKKSLFKKAQSFLLTIHRNILLVLNSFLSMTQLASSCARRSKQQSKHHHEAFANMEQREIEKFIIRQPPGNGGKR